MIFKDLIHYCQMGEGYINKGNTYCSVVKTLKTKESTRTGRGELSSSEPSHPNICCTSAPVFSSTRPPPIASSGLVLETDLLIWDETVHPQTTTTKTSLSSYVQIKPNFDKLVRSISVTF